jgi:CRP-like cAMP-binding protein
VSGSCFAERLESLVSLSPGEHRALERLEDRQRNFRRGAVLQRENDRSSELYVLKKGMMMSSVLLDDGSRQILRFLFPGDMMGESALIYGEAAETLSAVTDCVVCPFERPAFATLIAEHPRLAALIMVYAQVERVSLTDRLASLGRTSAKARVAALLLELRNRMRGLDKDLGATFTLGLTQEEIADATGLTAVHVNRMLRQLEDERLIARENGRVTILDEARLIRAANFVDRTQGLDLGWLPAAR